MQLVRGRKANIKRSTKKKKKKSRAHSRSPICPLGAAAASTLLLFSRPRVIGESDIPLAATVTAPAFTLFRLSATASLICAFASPPLTRLFASFHSLCLTGKLIFPETAIELVYIYKTRTHTHTHSRVDSYFYTASTPI